MGWARFDDAYPDHPKIALAGIHAELLDMRAILYACRFETDGLIPRAVLPIVGRGIPRTATQAKKLVEVGRWVETVDGWEILDFLDYNPSRASRESDREAARERMARARDARPRSRSSPEHKPNNDRSSPEVRVTPSRPDPKGNSSSSPANSNSPVENRSDDDNQLRIEHTASSVLERIADHRLTKAQGVRDRTSYRATILETLRNEIDLTRLRRVIADHRADTPIEMFADFALGNPTPYLRDYHAQRAEIGATP